MDYRIDKRDWSDWVFAACAIAGILAVTWLAVAVSKPASAGQETAGPAAAVATTSAGNEPVGG